MARLVVMVVTIFSTLVLTLAQELQLSIDSAKIQAGQSAKLKWNVGNADKIFISEDHQSSWEPDDGLPLNAIQQFL